MYHPPSRQLFSLQSDSTSTPIEIPTPKSKQRPLLRIDASAKQQSPGDTLVNSAFQDSNKHDLESSSYSPREWYKQNTHKPPDIPAEEKGPDKPDARHPIENLYPKHHGFAIFVALTVALLSSIIILIITFHILFKTPALNPELGITDPRELNRHTQHLTDYQKAFINHLPWNFVFSLIWLSCIWTMQFFWDKQNMCRSWRYRLGALLPLLFNSCLGTYFSTTVGFALLAGGVRPIVVTGMHEKSNGF